VRSVLLDSGPLIALFAVDDKHHRRFDARVRELARDSLRLITTSPTSRATGCLMGARSFWWIDGGEVPARPAKAVPSSST
jgi:hypothetical protein